MNVLVIGSGGREHALAWKLRQSSNLGRLYVAPGNPGTSNLAQNVPIEATDVRGMVDFALKNAIDLTIVGPDDPLAVGIVDSFNEAGLRIIGPTRQAARIESSKAFAKHLMQQAGIPTADFRVVDDFHEAAAYLSSQRFPLFIKATGLAQGKGAVKVSSQSEGLQILKLMMVDTAFGDAGKTVVIESYLDGPEISLHALCHADRYTMFPSSQDHKPLFDDDEGPNTGGMGTVAPLPWVDDDYVSRLGEQVVEPLLFEMHRSSYPFSGLLYPGLKLTSNGPKIIEYNARFGDPETQVYMRLLESDLLDVLVACMDGGMEGLQLQWKPNTFAVNVAITSGGYPGAYRTGLPIKGVERASALDDVVVFQAGTAISNDELVTNGGRVLYCSATGSSLEEARRKAYAAVALIDFKEMHFRGDIGSKAIALSRNHPQRPALT